MTICSRCEISWYIEIFIFKNSWPWNCWSSTRYTTVTVAPFDGKFPTSYLMVIVMFALSLTVYEIFANIKNAKRWPWKWKSWSRSRKTGLAPFDYKYPNLYRWIFQNCNYLGTYVNAKGNPHTSAVMTIGKICKADLLKNLALIRATTDLYQISTISKIL